MPDVGRVTPGKPIWPVPAQDETRRRREEQEQDTGKRERRDTPQPPSHPADEPPADGHIDEYA
ncbi:MAG: hypothetical protein AB7U81_13855 [Thiohalomonadaceae bacterium]